MSVSPLGAAYAARAIRSKDNSVTSTPQPEFGTSTGIHGIRKTFAKIKVW
jgi:hypothetical protein